MSKMIDQLQDMADDCRYEIDSLDSNSKLKTFQKKINKMFDKLKSKADTCKQKIDSLEI